VAALVAAAVGSCERSAREPARTERQLASSLGFPESVIKSVASAGTAIRQLQGLRDDGTQFLATGITVDVPSRDARSLLERLRTDLRGSGYEAFLAEMHFSQKTDKIAILPAGEKFAFVKLRGTNGWNYELSPAQIIARLEEWDKRFGLTVVGAGFDWVEVALLRQPEDLNAFAREVYTFCPDILDQGTETVERLASEIKDTNSVFLWWD
jgi:Domain of unknown function (DUF4253)